MDRRKFLQFFGAGAAVTAAGLMVPDVARKFFLPPRAGWSLGTEPGLNVGDILTISGSPHKFIVISINGVQQYIPVWS